MSTQTHRSRLAIVAGMAAAGLAAVSVLAGSGSAAASAAPKNTSKPTISGPARVGAVLKGDPGSWKSGSTVRFSFHWQRCNENGGSCRNIGGATGREFTVRVSDVRHRLRLLVAATNRGGRQRAVSDPTGVVRGASPAPKPRPKPKPSAGGCKPVADVSLPNQLLVDQIRYSPSVIRSRSEPLVARFHVVATAGGCVSGALVYAVGVPFDRLSKAAETPTGGDGWATISFHVLPTFQLRRGNLVVIFVRGRKPGDSVLAGVSTRRLVSVRVG